MVSSEDVRGVKVEFDVGMTLSDGTTLRANIYRPEGEGNWPVLMTRIPYGKDNFYESGFHQGSLDPIRAARRGFIVVVQDVRGTHASDGAFEPFRHEYEDGAEAVRWAASLPYSSGKLGMYGGSYFGFSQLAAAYGPNPAVNAIIPRQRCADPENGMYFRQGAFELCIQGIWYLVMSVPEFARTGADPRLAATAMAQLARDVDALPTDGYNYRPLNQFAPLKRPGVDGPLNDTFFALLQEPINLEPLQFLNVTSRLDKVDAPAFHIGGWYDIFIQQTLDDYVALQGRGVPSQLLVGPGSHGVVTLNPVGERIFGLGAQDLSLDLADTMFDAQIRWFDRWLKGEEGKAAARPIKMFIMGEDRWADFDQWPVPVTPQDWYLQPGGALSTSVPTSGGDSGYIYDPADPVPTRGGCLMADVGHKAGAFDQRKVEDREDVLVFSSEPLAEDLCIIGKVTAHIWASSDAVDTDFVVRVCDVTPDGVSWNIVDGIVRAQYRNGYDQPNLITPGTPYRYEIDLWSTANTFKKGHRIRVQVTSSCFPRWDANPNTGTPFSSTEVKRARQVIHHSPEQASFVTLPIFRG